MLSVETEANEDSKSTNERGPSLIVRWDFHVDARDFCPALVGPVLKIFIFSLYTILIL
jgi:hypothetical protein